MIALCFDVGGSKYVAGLVDGEGNVLCAERREWEALTPEGVVSSLVAAGRQLMGAYPNLRPEVIGVTIPGLAKAEEGLWVEASFSGIRNLPIGRLLREAFGLNTGHPDLLANNEFVVLGLGAYSNLRGSAIAEVPLVQSADPTHYYARVLCIYMIPSSTAAAQDKFPATFLGCILPDGTSRTANIEQYNNSRDTDT